ncbi:hypothetical protein [Psychromicrobium xiongbiense]|uniref:hypothetical protein n=1 Tax=Psychromicrobium xiongbiense TaxID=3051184 RepID=UPI0025573900|nr:hypothetical protein [Psychromicrobium sp. YIM S02556]
MMVSRPIIILSSVAAIALAAGFAQPANAAENRPAASVQQSLGLQAKEADPLSIVMQAAHLTGNDSLYPMRLASRTAAADGSSDSSSTSLDATTGTVALQSSSGRKLTLRSSTPGVSYHGINSNGVVGLSGKANSGFDVVLAHSSNTHAAGYVVIGSDSAPTEYEFSIEVDGTPAGLKILNDGKVEVTDLSGNMVNIVNPAWALDAKGHAVPSLYTLRDGHLVQVVQHSSTNSYPVTADPELACDWLFCTMEWNRDETAYIKNGGFNTILTAVTGGCAAFNWAVGFACGLDLAIALSVATDAYNRGECFGIRRNIPGGILGATFPVSYSGGNCH